MITSIVVRGYILSKNLGILGLILGVQLQKRIAFIERKSVLLMEVPEANVETKKLKKLWMLIL